MNTLEMNERELRIVTMAVLKLMHNASERASDISEGRVKAFGPNEVNRLRELALDCDTILTKMHGPVPPPH